MNFANKVYGICLSERALKNGMTYNHLQTKEEYRNFLQQEIDNAKSTYISYGYDSKKEKQEIAIRIVDSNNNERIFFCSAKKDKMKYNILYCFSSLANPIANHEKKILITCKFKICKNNSLHENYHDANELREFVQQHFDTPTNSNISTPVILDSNNETYNTAILPPPNALREMQLPTHNATQMQQIQPHHIALQKQYDDYSAIQNSYEALTQSSINIFSCNEILTLFQHIFIYAKSYIIIHCPWVYDNVLRQYQPLYRKSTRKESKYYNRDWHE